MRISIEYLWSIGDPLKMSAHGVVIHKIYNPTENGREHRKTSKIIWYHSENNWGPIIDNFVQFEEDFNSRTKKLWSGGVDWIGYLRPVQFLDHLTVIKPLDHHRLVDYQIVLNYHTIFPFKNTFGWDWIARKYPDYSQTWISAQCLKCQSFQSSIDIKMLALVVWFWNCFCIELSHWFRNRKGWKGQARFYSWILIGPYFPNY